MVPLRDHSRDNSIEVFERKQSKPMIRIMDNSPPSREDILPKSIKKVLPDNRKNSQALDRSLKQGDMSHSGFLPEIGLKKTLNTN